MNILEYIKLAGVKYKAWMTTDDIPTDYAKTSDIPTDKLKALFYLAHRDTIDRTTGIETKGGDYDDKIFDLCGTETINGTVYTKWVCHRWNLTVYSISSLASIVGSQLYDNKGVAIEGVTVKAAIKDSIARKSDVPTVSDIWSGKNNPSASDIATEVWNGKSIPSVSDIQEGLAKTGEAADAVADAFAELNIPSVSDIQEGLAKENTLTSWITGAWTTFKTWVENNVAQKSDIPTDYMHESLSDDLAAISTFAFNTLTTKAGGLAGSANYIGTYNFVGYEYRSLTTNSSKCLCILWQKNDDSTKKVYTTVKNAIGKIGIISDGSIVVAGAVIDTVDYSNAKSDIALIKREIYDDEYGLREIRDAVNNSAQQGDKTNVTLTSVSNKIGEFENAPDDDTLFGSVGYDAAKSLHTKANEIKALLTLADGEVTNELNSL